MSNTPTPIVESTLLDKALALSRLGVYVYPTYGKAAPLSPHGFQDATIDEAQIRAWWSAYPTADVGYHVGRSGLVVEDLDISKDGLQSGFTIVWQHFPEDYESAVWYNSRSGGQHLVFKDPNPEAPLASAAPIWPNSYVDRLSGEHAAIWYGPAPTLETWSELTDAPAWLLAGGKPSRSGVVDVSGIDTDEFIRTLQPGDAPSDLDLHPSRYGEMQSAIHAIVERALHYPGTLGLADAYETAAASYVHSTQATTPESQRARKVADYTAWCVAVITPEAESLRVGLEWAQGHIPSVPEPVTPWILEPGHASAPDSDPLTPLLPPSEAEPVSSWAPIDVEDILNGSYKETQPTVLQRDEGPCLFYPGCVNDLHGESESGKSWVALAAALEVINRNEHVRYLDFESSPGEVISRMLRIGATRDHIRQYFHYYRPEADPFDLSNRTVVRDFQAVLDSDAALVVIDGVSEAMSVSGLDPEKNKDIPVWMRIPKSLAKTTGAAVVLIDHVVKSGESRGRFMIGAQHKMSAIDGASYLVEPEEGIAKGKVGQLAIKVAKDRPGVVRAASGAYGRDRLQLTAIVEVDSTHPFRTFIRVKNHTASAAVSKIAQQMQANRDAVYSSYLIHKSFRSISDITAAVKQDCGLSLTREEAKNAMLTLESEGLIEVAVAVKKGKSTSSKLIEGINLATGETV